MRLWGVVACSTRWPAPGGVHPSLEVGPALLGDGDVGLRELAGVFAQHVQQDDEVLRAAVEDAVELRSVVAAQLAQWAADLA
jgi:hypothetical protein